MSGCPHVLENLEILETSWNFFLSWNLSWNLLFSEFCPGNILEFFCTVHQLFSQSLFLYFALSNFILYFLSLCIFTTSHAIIDFFSFSKNNVAKRNCTFFNHWLIEFEWVEKGPSARTAYCQLYHHTFDISNMRSTVISHSEGKKHKDKEISRKLLPISFLQKKRCFESYCVGFRSRAMSICSVLTSDVQHREQCTLSDFLLNSGVNTVDHSNSFDSYLTAFF